MKPPILSLLLDKLCEMRAFLSQRGKKVNVFEAYDYFKKHSDKGENCGYAKKCLEQFNRELKDEAMRQIRELYDIVKEIEGRDG
jgi:hypothetical protein